MIAPALERPMQATPHPDPATEHDEHVATEHDEQLDDESVDDEQRGDPVTREAGLRTGAPDVLRAAASDTRRRAEHHTPDATPEHWAQAT